MFNHRYARVEAFSGRLADRWLSGFCDLWSRDSGGLCVYKSRRYGSSDKRQIIHAGEHPYSALSAPSDHTSSYRHYKYKSYIDTTNYFEVGLF